MKRAKKKPFFMIVNPCGEIPSGFMGRILRNRRRCSLPRPDNRRSRGCFPCYHTMLIRVNLMDSVYKREVTRTNRIGVGMTGVHEFAWKFFGYGFRDLIDESKSKDFWMTLSRFKRAVQDEARKYAKKKNLHSSY